MPELCNLQIHVNGQQTFYLNQRIILEFSGKLRKIILREDRIEIEKSGIEIEDFPGGGYGFELVSRFCYNNGRIPITVSNVSLLHCCALFLGMTEKISPNNLFCQTEDFLRESFHWSWSDTLTCLKNCESFFLYADSSGLVEILINSLISKISRNSDPNSTLDSLSSSSSSSELLINPSSKSTKSWWFDELTILSPLIIQKFIKILDSYGTYNNTIITKFLLHYLKTSSQSKLSFSRSGYARLADRAVFGVISLGKNAYSCRGLFWVLKIVSSFGVSKGYRTELEKLIGCVIDEANLDDLLVNGSDDGSVYDVSLVVRLIRVFVYNCGKVEGGEEKIRKVSGLVDKYLREIGADHKLKISKFIGVAESLPQTARKSFDGVYRAIDIFLESHPRISTEERSRICKCLNYKKLSLETCKELAKNPRIPPLISMQALSSQHTNIKKSLTKEDHYLANTSNSISRRRRSSSKNSKGKTEDDEEDEDGLMKMQWRLIELEKACRDMKGQIMGKTNGSLIVPTLSRTLPRMC